MHDQVTAVEVEVLSPYQQLKSDCQQLLSSVEQAGSGQDITPELALGFFKRHLAIEASREVLFEQESSSYYPHRREDLFQPLRQASEIYLEQIGPLDLDVEQTETFVSQLLQLKLGTLKRDCGLYCHYDKKQKYYYVESGSPSSIPEDQDDDIDPHELINRIAQDHTVELSDPEFARVLQYEADVYKLHLNIPLAQRLPFINRLIDHIKTSRQTLAELRQSNPPLTRQEFVDRARALSLGTAWKFSGFGFGVGFAGHIIDKDGNPMSDFIFYAHPDKGSELTNTLSRLCRDFEDNSDSLPRFSWPVTGPDGYQHTGLSFTHGDGDFKLYLQRHGVLDQYYDSSVNHSRAL